MYNVKCDTYCDLHTYNYQPVQLKPLNQQLCFLSVLFCVAKPKWCIEHQDWESESNPQYDTTVSQYITHDNNIIMIQQFYDTMQDNKLQYIKISV